MGDLDRLNARGGARPIDPTSGVPGGQTAWEAATSGASPPAGGGGDLSTDRGQMPTGSQRLGQISGRMPPLPSRSGGDPPPPAAGAPDGAAALGGSSAASAGSPPAGEDQSAGQAAQADAVGSGSSGASSAGRPPAESGGSGAQKAGSPPAEGQVQGQAGGGENASTNGQMQSGTAGDGQKAGQSSNSSAGQAGDRRSQAKAGEPGSPGGPPSPFGSTPRASRPFQLVLACGPKGVAVQPGDYRVTKATLRAKETLLIAQLRAIVREEETLHPGRPLRPSIRYLIQPGGHETYTIARGQLDFSDLAWPGSVGFTGGDAPRLFSTDDW
jgi:hypothetical protein